MSAVPVIDGLDEIRWPLAPLLDACELTPARLVLLVGVPVSAVHAAVRRGLTDIEADRWAIRAGLHPVSVWGWAWVEAATNPAPQQPTSTTAAIAGQIRRRIDHGELQPGDPVPSIQSLAQEWGVTTTTAARAIKRLHVEGRIVIGGRGHRTRVARADHAEPTSEGGGPA